jgi:hypothetical protein
MNLQEYAELITGKTCWICGRALPCEVEHKPHPFGWVVDGYEEKQWLFITCPGCGNELSLGKFGVERP